MSQVGLIELVEHYRSRVWTNQHKAGVFSLANTGLCNVRWHSLTNKCCSFSSLRRQWTYNSFPMSNWRPEDRYFICLLVYETKFQFPPARLPHPTYQCKNSLSFTRRPEKEGLGWQLSVPLCAETLCCLPIISIWHGAEHYYVLSRTWWINDLKPILRSSISFMKTVFNESAMLCYDIICTEYDVTRNQMHDAGEWGKIGLNPRFAANSLCDLGQLLPITGPWFPLCKMSSGLWNWSPLCL